MTGSQPLPVTESITDCKCCAEKINLDDQFCQKCGFPLKGSEEEQTRFFYHRNYQHMEINSLGQKIKSAGTTMYVLAGIFFVYGLGYFFINRADNDISGILITYVIVAAIFLALGIWANKKPVAAIISGMVLYVLLQLMAAIDNPLNLLSGIIFKIIIISYLIKGLLSALEAEKIKRQYHI